MFGTEVTSTVGSCEVEEVSESVPESLLLPLDDEDVDDPELDPWLLLAD